MQLAWPLAHEVVLAMIGEGVLATEAGADVVRMSPALIVDEEQIDVAVQAFAALGSVADAVGWSQ